MLFVKLAGLDDAQKMTDARNACRTCFFDSSILTVEQTITWLEKVIKNPFDYMFIVYDAFNGPIGQFSIYNIKLNGSAEFGRVILYRNRKDYSRSFLSVCMTNLQLMMSLYNLKVVKAETFSWNKSALRFFARMGFVIKDEAIKNDGNGPFFRMERERKEPFNY